MKYTVFVLLGLFSLTTVNAQGFQWWNDLHDWNGVTPWRRYIQLSTSGLGPNALPVPTFNSREIKDGYSIDNQLRYHHNPDDPTFDHQIRIDYQLFNRIGIAAWMVTAEYYNTSIALRNQRKLREFEPKGIVSGDVYLSTYLNILQENQNRPTLLLSANLKTASGNNLGGGRHTDTPGYYFDLLAAKTYGAFRPYIASGLYVYQTFSTRNYQNDAFLYGIGTHFNKHRYEIQLEWAGYIGYFDIGDKPSVIRVDLSFKINDNNRILIRTQTGLNDFDYHTISLGYTYIYRK
ncbi:hypothetical protein [Portibacter marinus]|uniref:hypothetical protein n=1 Tax=Portibacter marinus TaxID=2898660 RepID=UPI001F1E952E|nr:hypothetical protein [Portibacter marinus]